MDPGVSVRAVASRLVRGQFTPSAIAGLQLWLDAVNSPLWQDAGGTTAAVADADPVRRWDDLSGNGRNATAGTDSKRPTFKLNIQNGKPALRSDGVDDGMTVPYAAALMNPTAMTFFVVVKGLGDDPTWSTLLMTSSANSWVDGYGIYKDAVGTRLRFFASSVASNVAVSAEAGSAIYAFGFSGESFWSRLNGVAGETGSIPGGVTPSVADLSLFQHLGLYPFSCDLMELIIYNAALSPTDVAAVESHLNAKWGIY